MNAFAAHVAGLPSAYQHHGDAAPLGIRLQTFQIRHARHIIVAQRQIQPSAADPLIYFSGRLRAMKFHSVLCKELSDAVECEGSFANKMPENRFLLAMGSRLVLLHGPEK